KEKETLSTFLKKKNNKFSPEAREALKNIINQKKSSPEKADFQVPQYMKEIWNKDIKWPDELNPKSPKLTGKEALAKGKAIFSISETQSRKEAQQLADWSRKY